MKLYLVRHGDSLSSDIDPSSPLSQKGVLETKRLAQVLKEFNLDVSKVWHSVKLRAKETAKLLMPDADLEEKEGLKPNDPVEPILEEIEAIAENVMIVGHLPFLEKMVQALYIEGLQSFRFENSAILALEKNGVWELSWTISPKIFY